MTNLSEDIAVMMQADILSLRVPLVRAVRVVSGANLADSDAAVCSFLQNIETLCGKGELILPPHGDTIDGDAEAAELDDLMSRLEP